MKNVEKLLHLWRHIPSCHLMPLRLINVDRIWLDGIVSAIKQVVFSKHNLYSDQQIACRCTSKSWLMNNLDFLLTTTYIINALFIVCLGFDVPLKNLVKGLRF